MFKLGGHAFKKADGRQVQFKDGATKLLTFKSKLIVADNVQNPRFTKIKEDSIVYNLWPYKLAMNSLLDVLKTRLQSCMHVILYSPVPN